MAYGAEPAPCRRESREHAPTLGRTAGGALRLSTGGQSEDDEEELEEELEDDVEDVEVLEDVAAAEEEEESDEDEAGVVEDDVARLSVR